MKGQESARVVVGPKYGFGKEGNPALGIPGDAELLFEIRLNSFSKVCNVCVREGRGVSRRKRKHQVEVIGCMVVFPVNIHNRM